MQTHPRCQRGLLAQRRPVCSCVVRCWRWTDQADEAERAALSTPAVPVLRRTALNAQGHGVELANHPRSPALAHLPRGSFLPSHPHHLFRKGRAWVGARATRQAGRVMRACAMDEATTCLSHSRCLCVSSLAHRISRYSVSRCWRESAQYQLWARREGQRGSRVLCMASHSVVKARIVKNGASVAVPRSPGTSSFCLRMSRFSSLNRAAVSANTDLANGCVGPTRTAPCTRLSAALLRRQMAHLPSSGAQR